VLALLTAVGFCAPERTEPLRLNTPPTRTAVALSLTALFVASSLLSTKTFLTSWQDNPTKSYLQNAIHGLSEANAASSAPILDQEVDPLILQRVVGPENLVSHMFALISDRPAFGDHTSRLRMFTTSGHLVDANVTWVRRMAPGPQAQCGYFVQPDAPVRIPLDGPLLPADWTAEINYLANTEGTLQLSLPAGREARVAVRPGLNRVYVRLSGAGDAIIAKSTTAALTVCLASGPVGYLAPR
jgi:hypothetical protein